MQGEKRREEAELEAAGVVGAAAGQLRQPVVARGDSGDEINWSDDNDISLFDENIQMRDRVASMRSADVKKPAQRNTLMPKKKGAD